MGTDSSVGGFLDFHLYTEYLSAADEPLGKIVSPAEATSGRLLRGNLTVCDAGSSYSTSS